MKFLTIVLTLLAFNIVFADEGGIHTPNVCSATAATTCAHLRFDQYPVSSVANEFIVHIMSERNEQVQNVSVKLWMDMGGHGHGSAPVQIEALDELNHFHISNAWFVMRGTWQVIVNFTDAGVAQTITIPVTIKE